MNNKKLSLIESRILGYKIHKSVYKKWKVKVRQSFYWRIAAGIIFGSFFGLITDSIEAIFLCAFLAVLTLVISHFCLFLPIVWSSRLFFAIITFGVGSGSFYHIINYYRNNLNVDLYINIAVGIVFATVLYFRGMFDHPKYYDEEFVINSFGKDN